MQMTDDFNFISYFLARIKLQCLIYITILALEAIATSKRRKLFMFRTQMQKIWISYPLKSNERND